MKRVVTIGALLAATLGFSAAAPSQTQAPPKALQIYFIDVEGGQSTLIVTPAGESLLVDAGFPGAGVWSAGRNGEGSILSWPGDPQYSRDPQRVLRAARDAGVSAIDYLLVTHYHPDHDGGVPELAQLIPIRTFIDHGDVAADLDELGGSLFAFGWHATVRAKGRHLVPKPGDRLPLEGINAVVVSTSGATIDTALPDAGAPNAACGAWRFQPDNKENPRSVGFHLQFGKFRFVQLGDLAGPPLFRLFCPNDLLGPIDLYQLPHHGNADSGANPGALGAVPPRVAVMNNGSLKGGSAATFAALHAAQGIEDVWQLHRSIIRGAQNFGDDRIANLDENHPPTTAYWIKVSAYEDGSFVVTNERTGAGKNYAARGVSSAGAH